MIVLRLIKNILKESIWFHKESKNFMEYQKGNKLYFWLNYPKSYFKFMYYMSK